MQTAKNCFLGLFFIGFSLAACAPNNSTDSEKTNTTTSTSANIADATPPAKNAAGVNIKDFPELALPLTIDKDILTKNKKFRVIEEAHYEWFTQNYSEITLTEGQVPPTSLNCFHTKMNGNQYLVGIIYSVKTWNYEFLLYTQLFDSNNKMVGEAKQFPIEIGYKDGQENTSITITANEIRTTSTNETWDRFGDDESGPSPRVKDEVTTTDSLFTFTPNGLRGKQLKTQTRPTVGND